MKGLLACAISTLLVACGGSVPQPPQVTVPNVVGLSVAQAHSTLGAAGLRTADDLQGTCPPEPHFGQGEPIVIAQQPAAQAHAVKGSLVRLHAC